MIPAGLSQQQLQFSQGHRRVGQVLRAHFNRNLNTHKHSSVNLSCSSSSSDQVKQAGKLFSNLNPRTLKHEPGSVWGSALLVSGTTIGAGKPFLGSSFRECKHHNLHLHPPPPATIITTDTVHPCCSASVEAMIPALDSSWVCTPLLLDPCRYPGPPCHDTRGRVCASSCHPNGCMWFQHSNRCAHQQCNSKIYSCSDTHCCTHRCTVSCIRGCPLLQRCLKDLILQCAHTVSCQ